MSSSVEKVLSIDSKDSHINNDNVFAIHPSKIKWLADFQKETFDKVVIQNVSNEYLKSINFFYIGQTVKKNGVVDVYVDQQIKVMQELEASEIETNAKLAGFTGFEQQPFERWVKKGNQQLKISTIKVSMVIPEKVVKAK